MLYGDKHIENGLSDRRSSQVGRITLKSGMRYRHRLTRGQTESVLSLGGAGDIYHVAEALRRYPDSRASEHHPEPLVTHVLSEASRRSQNKKSRGRGNWGQNPIARNARAEDGYEYQTAKDYVSAFLQRDTKYTNTDAGLAAIQLETLLAERHPDLYRQLVEIELHSDEGVFYAIFTGKLSKDQLTALVTAIGNFAEAKPVVNRGDKTPDNAWQSDVTVIEAKPYKGQKKKQAETDVRSRNDAPLNTKEDYQSVECEGGLGEAHFRYLFQINTAPTSAVDENGVVWREREGKYLPLLGTLDEANRKPTLKEAVSSKTFSIAGRQYTLHDLSNCFEDGIDGEIERYKKQNPDATLREALAAVIGKAFGEDAADEETLNELTTTSSIPHIAPDWLGMDRVTTRRSDKQKGHAVSSEKERKRMRDRFEKGKSGRKVPFGFQEADDEEEPEDKEKGDEELEKDGEEKNGEEEPDDEKQSKDDKKSKKQPPSGGEEKEESPKDKARNFIQSIRDQNYRKYAEEWYKYVKGESNKRPDPDKYEIPAMDAQMLRMEFAHLGFSEHGVSATPKKPEGGGGEGGEPPPEEEPPEEESVVDTDSRDDIQERRWDMTRERKGGHHHPHGKTPKEPQRRMLSLSSPLKEGQTVREYEGDVAGYVETVEEPENGIYPHKIVVYEQKRPFEKAPRAQQKKRPKSETDYESEEGSDNLRECLKTFTKKEKRDFAEAYANYLQYGGAEPKGTDYGIGRMAENKAREKIAHALGTEAAAIA